MGSETPAQRGCDPVAEGGAQRVAGPFETDERHQETQDADDDGGGDEREGNRQDGGRGRERPAGGSQRRAPLIEPCGRARLPQTGSLPEPGPAVHRGEERADRAGAAAGGEINLDPRFVQRPKDAGVVGPGRTRTGQRDGRAEPRRVLPVRCVWRDS